MAKEKKIRKKIEIMKIKKNLAGVLLALCALTACTNDPLVDGSREETGEGVLKLSMTGLTLDASKQTQTRAPEIATPAENEVRNLILLVGAADVDEAGMIVPGGACKVYEYRKDWGAETPATGVNKLELSQAGTVVSGKVDISDLTQGKLWVKALVNGVGIRETGAAAVLTAAEMAAKDVETQFEWLRIDASDKWTWEWTTRPDATAKIVAPLPMMGKASMRHTGLNHMDLQLYRQVARFDLRNGREDLRIGSITPMQASAMLDTYSSQDVREDMQPVSLLPVDTDPGMDWENVPSEIAPAFYTYGSRLKNEKQRMYFHVEAKLNKNGVWTEKKYKMYLQRDGKDIEIRNNTRYVINVQEITDDIITATIRIENWTEGEQADGMIGGSETDSKKVPQVATLTGDDGANGVTWMLNPETGAIEKAVFNLIASGNYLQFTTPAAQPVTRAEGTDQPEVQVDIVSATGNDGDIWLRHTSEPGTGLNEGLVVHKLTVNLTGVENRTGTDLFVKVKNKSFPAKFVMFTVAGNKIAQAPLYEGVPAKELWLGGSAVPYYIAPVNAADGVQYPVSSPCPEGWNIPSEKDVIAFSGIANSASATTGAGSSLEEIDAAVLEAFPAGQYWTSTPVDNIPGNYWRIQLTSQSSAKAGLVYEPAAAASAETANVRCVRMVPPSYRGQEPAELNISGATASCFVAPADAGSGMQFTDNLASLCPAGWTLPTKNEIMAVVNVTEVEYPYDVDASVGQAFPSGTYWTRDAYDADRAWAVKVGNREGVPTVSVEKMNKVTGASVRCVRMK